MSHILTHSQYSYLLASLTLLTFGSSSLAEKMSEVIRSRLAIHVVVFHLAILITVTAAAFATPMAPSLRIPHGTRIVLYVIGGLFGGGISVWADRRILRRLSKRTVFVRSNPSTSAVVLSCAIAVCEELLYRGFLVDLCRHLLSDSLFYFAAGLTVIGFAVSHAYGGIEHVCAKFPLGALALISVIIFNSIIPAVIQHLYFNVKSTRADIFHAVQGARVGPSPYWR